MNFARKGLHGCCADVLLLTYWTTFRGVDTAPPLQAARKNYFRTKGNEHVRNVRVFSNQGKKESASINLDFDNIIILYINIFIVFVEIIYTY